MSTAAVGHFPLESAQEDFAMIRLHSGLNSLPERALDLVSQASDGIKHMVPNGGAKWLGTGAALGALTAGSRVAATLVRRHPAATVATVAGAGLLWYLARRRARQAENAPIVVAFGGEELAALF